jgi:16S rRNA (guanine(966)-N(2))-methyltransferase RsmD
MRVIAGLYRHRLLVAPEGVTTRPTLDRVKVSMFNIVQPDVIHARVLDLFAGSGALGIEALSRGASHVVFNDTGKAAQNAIRTNLNTLKIVDNVTVHALDYTACLTNYAQLHQRFDVVLLDPPFEAGYYEDVLSKLEQLDLLQMGGIIVVECPRQMNIDALKAWLFKTYFYGEIQLRIYRRPRA